MNDDITIAQVKAGEDVVVERLRQKGLMPPAELHIPADRDAELAALEHSLATTFVKWMFSKDPAERSQLWQSMFEIARKLKELDAD